MTSYSHDPPNHVRIPPDYPSYVGHEVASTRKRLPIPDLRFEQVYLRRIQDCVHIIEPRAADVKEMERAQPDVRDAEFIASTHVAPFIKPSQQIIRVDWGKMIYVTLRDQVLMPLLQGLVWGVVGTYYRPFVTYARGAFHGSPVPAQPVEGQGVGWLRSWLKRSGFSSITIGPPSL